MGVLLEYILNQNFSYMYDVLFLKVFVAGCAIDIIIKYFCIKPNLVYEPAYLLLPISSYKLRILTFSNNISNVLNHIYTTIVISFLIAAFINLRINANTLLIGIITILSSSVLNIAIIGLIKTIELKWKVITICVIACIVTPLIFLFEYRTHYIIEQDNTLLYSIVFMANIFALVTGYLIEIKRAKILKYKLYERNQDSGPNKLLKSFVPMETGTYETYIVKTILRNEANLKITIYYTLATIVLMCLSYNGVYPDWMKYLCIAFLPYSIISQCSPFLYSQSHYIDGLLTFNDDAIYKILKANYAVICTISSIFTLVCMIILGDYLLFITSLLMNIGIIIPISLNGNIYASKRVAFFRDLNQDNHVDLKVLINNSVIFVFIGLFILTLYSSSSHIIMLSICGVGAFSFLFKNNIVRFISNNYNKHKYQNIQGMRG
ncbi:MAG: hypothetical protein HUJ96_09760 [Marinilabiliaceae bacterium]|nr:hypothetical protein [Marinilabiliaceae bacterium]